MKKLSALLLAAILCASLTACSGSNSVDDEADTINSDSQQTVTADVPAAEPIETQVETTEVVTEEITEPVTEEPRTPIDIHFNDETWSEYFDIIVEEGTSVYYNGEELPDSICYFQAKDSSMELKQITFAMNFTVEMKSYTIDENNNIVIGETVTSFDTTYPWQRTFDSYDPNDAFHECTSPIKVPLVCGAEMIAKHEEYREAFEASESPVMFTITVTYVWGLSGNATIYE